MASDKPILLVIAHTNLGDSLSGGDRIFLNIIRYWKNKFRISVLGSPESRNLLQHHKITASFLPTTPNKSPITTLNTLTLFWHHLSRFITGKIFCLNHRSLFIEAQYIYTSSDFYGDFIFGFFAKLFNPKIKWLCGFYLLAPNPLDIHSPYIQNRHFFRGLIYYFAQIPTIILANTLADYVFVTSEPDIKIFKNKSLVIQGGVYIPPLAALKKIPPVSTRRYDAFFLGRLHVQKGVLELVDIWKLVTQQLPDAKLVIVGDGELMTELKIKINKLKLHKNIELKGFLIGDEKFQLIKNSKIVVHPATYDSGGMAAAEAMAWGLPGVSFDLLALKTYYPQGMVKVKLNDISAFSLAILNLLNNSSYYRQLSSQARQMVTNNWDWSKRLQNIYLQIR